MRKLFPLVISLGIIGCATACSDSQDVDEGEKDADFYDAAIELQINDESQGDVNIQDMASHAVTVSKEAGEQVGVPVADFISKIAGIKSDELDKYMCNYQSSKDGFKPTDKGDRCPMVSCSYALKTYIDAYTDDLFYDDDVPMSGKGCYNVSQVGKILIYTVEEEENESTGDNTENTENTEEA